MTIMLGIIGIISILMFIYIIKFMFNSLNRDNKGSLDNPHDWMYEEDYNRKL